MELMNRGMQCLTDNMGIIDAERFISIIIREKFDYTQWQREYFDEMKPGEIEASAVDFAKQHPYAGNAEQL